MTNKVYCKGCTNYRGSYFFARHIIPARCMAKEVAVMETHEDFYSLTKSRKHVSPKEYNKNNDCQYRIQKLWWMFWEK